MYFYLLAGCISRISKHRLRYKNEFTLGFSYDVINIVSGMTVVIFFFISSLPMLEEALFYVYVFYVFYFMKNKKRKKTRCFQKNKKRKNVFFIYAF